MGMPLKNPPVYFTVSQIRFNPILKLVDFVPTIQESMRKAGYADFSTQTSVIIQITIQDGRATPAPQALERYSFSNLDKTLTFVLDAQSLTLQSTNYGHFSAFLDEFMSRLKVVHDTVNLAFTERVGLRYLDRVMPMAGEDLGQYLVHEVLGIGNRLKGKKLHGYSESLSDFDGVMLRSRVVIQEGGLAFPPDLQPDNMPVDAKFTEYVGISAILDNDGFVEQREEFCLESVTKHLHIIHNVVGQAFKATTTPHALEVWSR